MGNLKEVGILVLVEVTNSDGQEEIRLTQRRWKGTARVLPCYPYSTTSSSKN